jgi:hypothetical protein
MWDRYDWIERFKREHPDDAARVVSLTREGETVAL